MTIPQEGVYFVTICTQNRECLFGEIINGQMKTNSLGDLMVKTWESLPNRFPVILDIYQVMPNHFHAIIFIVGAGLVPALSQKGHPQGVPLHTLGNIIGAFKSLSINSWGNGKFWQRNYFEHIIRNEKELFKIREYIEINPEIWERDRNNPKYDRYV